MKNTLIFLDVEATGKDPEDKLIQVAYKTTDNNETVNEFYSTDVKIKIEAMAVHHITEKMIANKPKFVGSQEFKDLKNRFEKEEILVAHNAKFDIGMLVKEGLPEPQSIDTFKIAHYLDTDGVIPSYSMQYLRYFLNIEIEAEAHDALGDILVLEQLFERQLKALMEKERLAEDEAVDKMIEISKQPLIYKFFTFGKYKNKSLDEVVKLDRGYLEWLYNQKLEDDKRDEDWIATLEKYLK